MAPRQGNVQKSVLQVQSCCFLLNSLASLSSDRILRSVIISTLTIALTGRLKPIEWSDTIISFSSRPSKRLCYYLSVQFSESVTTTTTTTAKKTFFVFFFYTGIEGAFYEPGSKTVIPRKVRICCFCSCLRYSNQVVDTWLTASGKN